MNIKTMMCSLVVLSLLALVAKAERAYPEVTFQYSPVFDDACASATKQAIVPEAVKELQDRLPSFQETWRADAPQLLGAVPELTGVPFHFREAKAALVLCGFPSMANPLMINVTRYLKATAKGPVAPVTVFSNAILHEILHRYVTDWLDTRGHTTPLLTKYANEPKLVLDHLHLFAIERLVYRKLGREKDLETVIASQDLIPLGPAFRRTREIVEKEKPESFLLEFRNDAAGNRDLQDVIGLTKRWSERRTAVRSSLR
jgi:hypothetical protein